jgi:hypothetical protein
MDKVKIPCNAIRKAKENQGRFKLMGHISLQSMLMMLIYLVNI